MFTLIIWLHLFVALSILSGSLVTVDENPWHWISVIHMLIGYPGIMLGKFLFLLFGNATYLGFSLLAWNIYCLHKKKYVLYKKMLPAIPSFTLFACMSFSFFQEGEIAFSQGGLLGGLVSVSMRKFFGVTGEFATLTFALHFATRHVLQQPIAPVMQQIYRWCIQQFNSPILNNSNKQPLHHNLLLPPQFNETKNNNTSATTFLENDCLQITEIVTSQNKNNSTCPRFLPISQKKHNHAVLRRPELDDEESLSESNSESKLAKKNKNNTLSSSSTKQTLTISNPVILASSETTPITESDSFITKEQVLIANLLQDTFAQFDIHVKVIDISSGPVISCYEILPPPGIKITKITGLQDNLALALATPNIRIIAPIPGKSAIGIEIPNQKRRFVSFQKILDSLQEKSMQSVHLPIILGEGSNGKMVFADLTQMPHLLIAGTTGSGKSVFVHTLICSLLQNKSHTELKTILIDPKRVELKSYDNIPHLLCPVLTNAKKASACIKWLVLEMENRYRSLENLNTRDLESFNTKILLRRKENLATPKLLPRIVLIMDEFADFILMNGKEMEDNLARLAAMARAVGIHLIIATQRPSVDVITGLIKANFPSRISFKVSGKMESRIILDFNGAEQLLGKGDMLFLSPGEGLHRIQSPYLSDDEIESKLNKIKTKPPQYDPELTEWLDEEERQNGSSDSHDDPLYEEAVNISIAEQRVSASYLQRRLRIGYNRAARIVETMENNGIVSGTNGGKPREILVESHFRIKNSSKDT